MNTATIARTRTDEEAFATEMEKALHRVDAHIRIVPLTTEDVVTNHAEKDAERILEGESTYSVTAPFRNILRAGDKSRESSYYGCGMKFYTLYCNEVAKTVQASKPERKLTFPDW